MTQDELNDYKHLRCDEVEEALEIVGLQSTGNNNEGKVKDMFEYKLLVKAIERAKKEHELDGNKQIIKRLDKIIELLQPVKSDAIKEGDKVVYDGKEYYYIGFSDNMHVLGDRFLRAMIGVENGDLIKKAVSKYTHWHPWW